MAYDVTTLTIKGAELLAAASATNKLILAGCDATQTYITKANAVNVQNRPASPFSTSTNVRLEGSNDSHVFMRIFFVAGQSTGGDVNSLYLYGHSESAPGTEYVIAIMSSQTAFHLPEEGDISNTYGTLLDVVFNVADGSIESVTSSVYATYSEYADLRDRAVTMHKQGEPTVGENQDIYGNKKFLGTIKATNSIESSTGYQSIVSKPSSVGNPFSTFYGDNWQKTMTVYGSSVAFDTSSLTFQTSDNAHQANFNDKDMHRMYMGANTLPNGGVTRYFSHESSIIRNSSMLELTSISTHLDRNFVTSTSGGILSVDEQETGRIELMVQEPLHNVSAKVVLDTEYPSGNTASPISKIKTSSTSFEIKADNGNNEIIQFKVEHDKIIIDGSIDNAYPSILIGWQSSNGEFSIYPGHDSSYTEINLGTSDYYFDNAYATTINSTTVNATTINATTVNGTVSNATNATNDANGNAITSYVKTIASMGGADTIYQITQGNSSAQILNLNTATATAVQGKTKSGDSFFGSVGAIGLFCYVGSAETYPLIKMPGETVSGTALKTAGFARNQSTGEVHIYTQPAGSASYMTGTWVLLSYLYMEDSTHLPLVLAVKTSLT